MEGYCVVMNPTGVGCCRALKATIEGYCRVPNSTSYGYCRVSILATASFLPFRQPSAGVSWTVESLDSQKYGTCLGPRDTVVTEPLQFGLVHLERAAIASWPVDQGPNKYWQQSHARATGANVQSDAEYADDDGAASERRHGQSHLSPSAPGQRSPVRAGGSQGEDWGKGGTVSIWASNIVGIGYCRYMQRAH